MNAKTAGCLGAALLLLAGTMAADQTADATSVAAGGTELKELQGERLAVAQKLAELVHRRNDLGQLPLGGVIEAERRVLDAELDAAETREERVSALERFLAVAERAERVAEARVEMGQASMDAPLEAKLAKLEARIDLERARSAQAR